MGSDDGAKGLSRIAYSIQRWKAVDTLWKRSNRVFLIMTTGCLALVLVVVVAMSHWFLPAPELWLSEHFSGQELMERLPQRCMDVAHHFLYCQAVANATWVMACHRKWCQDSWRGGHCEPCAGIGDRMRFLLSQVQDASESNTCVRVQLDYPVVGEMVLDSAIYQEAAGWLAELAHFRSYDVSSRLPPEKSVKTVNQQTGKSFLFTHFTPNGYLKHDYNACFFHILFQPDARLQQEIDMYNAAIDGSSAGASIGIHYRTGDVASFGIYLFNGDNRVKEIEAGWKRMLACANQLAEQLFPGQAVTYFLATDNADFKERIHRQQQAEMPQGSRGRIVTTAVRPGSYLQGMNNDRDALLELYLLSQRKALVINGAEKGYDGPAAGTSTFARLAGKIGFLPDDRIKVCSTDSE